jgi:hypothetical protein
LGDVREVFSPAPEGSSGFLQFGSENSCWVTVAGMTTPGGGDNIKEAGAVDLVIFKTENIGFRNGGGDINPKRDMVGSSPGEDGENSIRETLIPAQIDKSSVQPFQSRGGSLI